MCVWAPQDIKNVIGLRIDEKVGNHCLRNTVARVVAEKIVHEYVSTEIYHKKYDVNIPRELTL